MNNYKKINRPEVSAELKIDFLKRQYHAALEEIQRLKSDRPQGEWIEVDDISISCRCSVCGWEAHLYEDDVYGMPYCPNCGARMKGADDENESIYKKR